MNKYEKVLIFEKGYYTLSHKNKTNAVWHYEWVSVEEYIEILYQTFIENIKNNTSFEYVGDPYCKQEIYDYYKQKFNKPVSEWTLENRQEVEKLFHELSPQITRLRISLFISQEYKKDKKIIRTKIIIFSLYLICWSYILIISYYNYPIELVMFKYLIKNIMLYLVIGDDPFIDTLHSLNENLITIQSIKNLLMNIIYTIINKIIK